jgi:hypothetical protein
MSTIASAKTPSGTPTINAINSSAKLPGAREHKRNPMRKAVRIGAYTLSTFNVLPKRWNTVGITAAAISMSSVTEREVIGS